MRQALNEIAHQQRDVLPALAQGRHAKWENVQPVEKIAAELALRHQFAEVAIGSSKQSNIHLDSVIAAQAFELLVLQHSQKFRLQFQRDVSHFIEKQCSLVCQLQAAHLLGNGAGKRALLMSEQFAFQEAGGNRRTIQFDKALLFAGAHVVDGTGNQFLPGSRFSENQHGGIAGGHSCRLRESALQTWTVPNNLFEIQLGADFILKV